MVQIDFGALAGAFIAALGIPSAIMGFIVWRLERRIDDREKDQERKNSAQQKLMVLLVQSTRASIALGEATAHAMQRGHTNGDMEAALQMPDLFPVWEDVLAAGEKLAEGTILKDGKVLYRVVQAGGVTPQEHQPPHGEGMLAVYRPIDQSHAGTLEDPIPWVYGMDCHAGVYFSYQGHIYQVAEGGDMVPCVWAPGTAGLWQWVLIE